MLSPDGKLPRLHSGEVVPLDIDFSARIPTGAVGASAAAAALTKEGLAAVGLVGSVSLVAPSTVRLWLTPVTPGIYVIAATLTCDGTAVLRSYWQLEVRA